MHRAHLYDCGLQGGAQVALFEHDQDPLEEADEVEAEGLLPLAPLHALGVVPVEGADAPAYALEAGPDAPLSGLLEYLAQLLEVHGGAGFDHV
jgi:hypothetical protein